MDALRQQLERLAAKAAAESWAIVYRECGGEGRRFAAEESRLFHAASTIKLALLFALFRGVEQGRYTLEDRLHVRNRFFSIADGAPYAMEPSRDGDSEVYSRLGRTMAIGELARWMIITSSNLATNILLDYVGLDFAREQLAEAHLGEGLELRRGVEDHAAFDQGINNRVSATGLAELLEGIETARLVTPASREAMLDILADQRFNDMIPRGWPEGTRVAHKTGEISSVCHDAGLVYPENAAPGVLVILLESSAAASARRDAVAGMARAIRRHFYEEAEGSE